MVSATIRPFPGLGMSRPVFAVVGVAAMLAGSFHAPLFATMMVFETVGAHLVLVPSMLAAAIGNALATVPAWYFHTFSHTGLGIRLRSGRFTVMEAST